MFEQKVPNQNQIIVSMFIRNGRQMRTPIWLTNMRTRVHGSNERKWTKDLLPLDLDEFAMCRRVSWTKCDPLQNFDFILYFNLYVPLWCRMYVQKLVEKREQCQVEVYARSHFNSYWKWALPYGIPTNRALKIVTTTTNMGT